MSIRVTFDLGAKDGLESMLLDGMQDFKAWYEKLVAEWPNESDPQIIESANEVLSLGRNAFDVDDQCAAVKIDKLVDEFIGAFCDHGDGQHMLKNAHNSSIRYDNYWRYRDYFAEGSLLKSFWHYLLNGRPVFRNPKQFPYRSSDGISRVAFFTATEVITFRSAFQEAIPFEQGALSIAQEALDVAYKQELGLIITSG